MKKRNLFFSFSVVTDPETSKQKNQVILKKNIWFADFFPSLAVMNCKNEIASAS